MSVIINKKKEETKEEPKRAWSCVLMNAPAKFFAKSKSSKPFLVLTNLTEDQLKVFEDAPCEVDVAEGSALFNISRFCEFSVGKEPSKSINDWEGANKVESVVNVKLRHSEFDHKGGAGYRPGHVSRLEVVGIRFVGEIKPITGNMEGI